VTKPLQTSNSPRRPVTAPHQREQLGLAHAIFQAEPHVDGPFVLMLDDNVFRGKLGDITIRQ